MSSFDQTSEHYWTATGKALEYKHRGRSPETIICQLTGAKLSPADEQGSLREKAEAEGPMFKEMGARSKLRSKIGSEFQGGCGS
jgi:hypothetical protein